MNLKVGDTLYFFDTNRRKYRDVTAEEKAAGKVWPNSGPIYREHFRPVKITGETKGTWTLGDSPVEKVNKKTLRAQKTAYGQHRLYTLEQMEQQIYIHDNAKRIANAVEYCPNVALLKQIDAMVTAEKSSRFKDENEDG